MATNTLTLGWKSNASRADRNMVEMMVSVRRPCLYRNASRARIALAFR
jgi:hypothetical protein